ncbi:MAG: VOC family protein [Bacillota bacterium]|nr:VOC family protein [Bacillota bacterium]
MQLLHVTIQTNKFDEELKFYQDIIGLKIVRKIDTPDMNIVFLADAEGGTEIEIINNPDAADAGNQNLSIGFKTENVPAKREELIAAGFQATPIIIPNPQTKFFFVKDPAGVSVQFI